MVPKISIITITLNSERYLEQTITSVINQSYRNIEYIIVDGGSTDNTLDIINNYESRIYQWVSKSDNGIADAMNNGISLSSGDYILFLHSDDYLANKSILSTSARFLSTEYDIFLYDIFLSKNGNKKLCHPRGFNWWMNLKTGVFHQSTICSKDLFNRIGNFDTSFRIEMDYDFFLRAYRQGVKAKKINETLSIMRLCGISSQVDLTSLENRLEEEYCAHMKNCSDIPMKLLYRLYWLCYPVYKYHKHR